MGFCRQQKPVPPNGPFIDNSAIKRLVKGKLPSHSSAWGVDVCPPKACVKIFRTEREFEKG
jgi:hypothetical protein